MFLFDFANVFLEFVLAIDDVIIIAINDFFCFLKNMFVCYCYSFRYIT